MDEPLPSRRTVLRTGGAAVASAALAGCFGGDATDGSPSFSPSTPLGAVPADAGIVLAVDFRSLFSDDRFRDAMNDRLARTADDYGGGPTSVAAGLDSFQEALGLDPRAVSTVVGFDGFGGNAPAGAVVWTDWSLDDVRGVMERGTGEVSTDEYRGRTVLEPASGTAVAALDDGSYTVGSRPAVEAVADLDAGEADPVGGRVREGFEATAAGAVRLAFGTPAAPDAGGSSSRTAASTALAALTHGYGAYDIDGQERRAWLTLATESADGAETVREVLETNLGRRRDALAAADGRRRPYKDELVRVIDDVEITREDATVAVTVDDVAPTMLVVFPALLPPVPSGLVGSPEPRYERPEVSFTFEYYADTGVVTVTHHGGDAVRGDLLTVEGEGFAAVDGADLTSAGPWAGETSSSTDGEPAIVAGDSVTVGVAGDDYTLRVVWQSADGTTSSELATHRGPGA